MILLGVVLLIIGFMAKITIFWTLGIIVVLVGAVLGILGHGGHQVAGRKHWF